MLKFLHSKDQDFKKNCRTLLQQRDALMSSFEKEAVEIIENVRKGGDEKLYDYTRRFDKAADPIRIFEKKKILQAYQQCDKKFLKALEVAAERIRFFHEKTRPEDNYMKDALGVELGVRFRPIDKVGLYVPGGRAAYPSSVLMSAIPAQVADVPRIIMALPAPENQVNPFVLACAHFLGLEEIHAIGGAQAVAAMAFGTETVPKVDVIVGPGNAWVAAAKKYVFGHVGIDLIAGPSEVLVVADHTQNPHWIAWDLLAQAEHDETAQSILICDQEDFARRVDQEIEDILKTLPRRDIAKASISKHGAALIVDVLDKEAPDLINQIAPEHLQLAVSSPRCILEKTKHAGAIFLGIWTPEALGDYLAGPSHILPTSGGARYSSGLSVASFMKRSSVIYAPQSALEALSPHIALLAEAEGLHAHAQSVITRTKEYKMTDEQAPKNSIKEITVDRESIADLAAKREYEQARFDLMREGRISLKNLSLEGPYSCHLKVTENRQLLITVVGDEGGEVKKETITLYLSALRGIIKDYICLCESYDNALKNLSPTQIEPIDMARRGLHDEASEILIEQCKAIMDLDENTARRLFTLIYALRIYG